MDEPCVTDYPPQVELGAVGDKDMQRRVDLLGKAFLAAFGKEPECFARAPGRVNLIGEHVDYCGYAVLPMAIQQDILVACSRNNSGTLNLSNTDGRYPSFAAPMDALKIDDGDPRWHHYFLCGVKGILESEGLDKVCTWASGMDVLVQGIVPPSAGLSSSSALVCAAALATLEVLGSTMSKLKLASLCSSAERYIGTQGGGMDQAIAFLAEPGTAKLIEFNPLRTTSVSLPEGATFVVADSCVEINKAATSDFNIRVVECQLAAQVIAKSHNLEKKKWRLAEVQMMLGVPLDQMASLAKKVLHPENYTVTELCEILQLQQAEFTSTFLTNNTKHVDQFKLYQRAVHVYEEAHRVWRFKDVCQGRAELISAEEQLSCVGQLMNESHTSCRDLYQCSHPDLDHLVEICLTAGALGSRLTGAGWGGCTISLVPSTKVDKFLDQVKSGYYDKLPTTNVAKRVFVTQPGGGAMVVFP